MREAAVADRVLVTLQRLGTTLFRNTVGKFLVADERTGGLRRVSVGLCVGSSDYIGFTEYRIRPEDVGKQVAVFTACETKAARGGRRSPEQIAFVERVRQAGGIGFFANSPEVAIEAVKLFAPRRIVPEPIDRRCP